MSVEPKLHIERLYQDRVENTLWCESMCDVANFADGALTGRFLNELLQNTDDAGGKEIEFQLQNGILTILHTGKHFSSTDVDKITAFAQQKIRDKSQEIGMTGYKGIGFKALLSIANKVHIYSGGYSFRFDKTYWGDKSMPWQLIPIWTDPPSYFDNRVIFIFQLNNPTAIQQQLEEFMREPRPLLFLRHVRSLKFSVSKKETWVIREDNTLQRNLQCAKPTQWMIKTIQIPIPLEVRKSVESLNSTLCPDRLKTAESIELTFAFLYDKESGNLVEPSSKMRLELFSTLPTKVRLDLPFAVNSEFLLEAQREQLIESPWNELLFQKMAVCLFSQLSELAQTDQWKNILHVLGPRTIATTDRRLGAAYIQGFKEGAKQCKWIPAFVDRHILLTLEECLIDVTRFYSKFKDHIPPKLVPTNLVNPHLKKLNKLIEIIPGNVIGESHIVNQLETIFHQNPDPAFCYQVLVFFQAYLNNWTALASKRWIPTEQGSLGQLSTSFFPSKQQVPSPPACIGIEVMHSSIFEQDAQDHLRKWLSTQGVRNLTAKNIVEKHIDKFIRENRVTKDNTGALVGYLFKLYRENYIEEGELGKLTSMPVLNERGSLTPIKQLFLSTYFNPDQNPDLKAIFPNQPELFVNPSYMNEERELWLSFFRALGVQENCDLILIESVSVSVLQTKNISQLKEFLKYLCNQSNGIIGRSVMSTDHLRNFIFFPMLENLSNSEFAAQFWRSLNTWGKKFIQTDRNCQFVDGRRCNRSFSGSKKQSYIQFILNEYAWIQGTDGKNYRAHQLYTPAFKTASIEGLVAADIEELSEDVAEYLGFKCSIAPIDCYRMLEQMQKGATDRNLYILVLENLIKGWPHLEEKEKEKLLKLKWHFIACNNQWQPANELAVFDVKEAVPSEQSKRWFKNVLSNMVPLATIFNRPIITECLNEKSIIDPTEDNEVRNSLLAQLHLIAWIHGHHSMQPAHDVLRNLAEKLKNLHIFLAGSIPSLEEDTLPLDIVLFHNRIYFTNECPKQKLYERIGEYLSLANVGDLKEILALAKQHTRRTKTIDDWIKEKGITHNELKSLTELTNSIDHTPTPLDLTTPTQVYSPGIKQQLSLDTPIKNEENSDFVTDFANLSLEPKKAPRQSSSIDPVYSSTPTKFPAASNSNFTTALSPNLDSDSDEEAGEPLIDIDAIPVAGITNLEFKEKKITSSPSSQKQNPSCKNNKPHSHTSDSDKSLIGSWGEALVFKELVAQYECKYETTEKISKGHFKFGSKEKGELEIRWLNAEKESSQPYDIELTRKTADASWQSPVEVKSTKGTQAHFFLSENEWTVMKSNPKYRLYLVIEAGVSDAKVYRIPKPKEWIENASVKIHKKFEVTGVL